MKSKDELCRENGLKRDFSKLLDHISQKLIARKGQYNYYRPYGASSDKPSCYFEDFPEVVCQLNALGYTACVMTNSHGVQYIHVSV